MSKNSNISKIRVGGFNQPWVKKRLGDALKHEQSWKYIESSTKYFNHGIPVLTPGKTFVFGYAKDTKNIKKASENSPIILFDDFTTQSRFIDFDFKVRSSALKLLINKNPKDNLYFHYLILQKIKYTVRHHGRHWLPLFVNFTFFQPDWPEQQKISRLFEALENLINKLEEKMELLKNLKNGFTNKMFANLNSDFPSIRFKGFKSPWITDQVKNLFEISRGESLTKNQIKTKPVRSQQALILPPEVLKEIKPDQFAELTRQASDETTITLQNRSLLYRKFNQKNNFESDTQFIQDGSTIVVEISMNKESDGSGTLEVSGYSSSSQRPKFDKVYSKTIFNKDEQGKSSPNKFNTYSLDYFQIGPNPEVSVEQPNSSELPKPIFPDSKAKVLIKAFAVVRNSDFGDDENAVKVARDKTLESFVDAYLN